MFFGDPMVHIFPLKIMYNSYPKEKKIFLNAQRCNNHLNRKGKEDKVELSCLEDLQCAKLSA